MHPALETKGHEVLTKHLIRDDAWESDRLISAKEVYGRDMRWLQECDCFIAEVSNQFVADKPRVWIDTVFTPFSLRFRPFSGTRYVEKMPWRRAFDASAVANTVKKRPKRSGSSDRAAG